MHSQIDLHYNLDGTHSGFINDRQVVVYQQHGSAGFEALDVATGVRRYAATPAKAAALLAAAFESAEFAAPPKRLGFRWSALLALFFSVAAGLAAANARADEVKPTAERTQVELRIVWASKAATAEKCASLGAWGGVVPRNLRHAVGCNAMNVTTNVCTVYAVKPTEVDDEATALLGHETLHCLEGAYHEQGAI